MIPIQRIILSFRGLCSGLTGGGRLPEGFVRLSDVVPSIETDMRYAGSENFTGRPVPGYRAPQCWVRREVAEALVGVAKDAAERGLRLVVYDCYRPQRATQAFIAWAADAADQAMKEAYYPHLDKREIFAKGYIAKASTHSLGIAVDIAFVDKDFGTSFDLFDEASSTDYAGVSEDARTNRDLLHQMMVKHGFENLPQEWWHFSYKGLDDAKPLDVEIK
ncbi:MAG: peptidase M15 [Candidimonas sp.]|nr:MAG: peptidase M15 [Beijerinckiaceae bacterium]TAM18277.1 MAG: peptidase M15 [Candidimonas sp.]